MEKLFLPEVITRGSFCVYATWTSIFTIPSKLCQSATTKAIHYQREARPKQRVGAPKSRAESAINGKRYKADVH